MWDAFKRVRPGFAEEAAQALATNPPSRDTHWVIGGMMGCGKTTLAKRLAADWVVFLDYDNLVNYWRLLRRGILEWRASGRLWGGFREHIIERTVKDLGRIVYLYGKENRAGWRREGIGGTACPTERVIRCISPAEAAILLDRVKPSFKDRG